MENSELIIEGRNAVVEALKADRSIDKLFIIDSEQQSGPIKTIVAEARKRGVVIRFETKEMMDKISNTNKHQGVIAYVAAYDYVEVEDILQIAKDKGEPPFVIILDSIEDPHNLGAILRTANIAGVHGVIIPKRRAVGLTATVSKTSAGAIEYTPVARVTNIVRTIEDLKKQGLWIACADMDGQLMYKVDLKGPLAIVVGGEGAGVGKLVKEKCDLIAKVPMKGDIDSLNVSVATSILVYEALRQRDFLS
ncbi:MAG: 23S rRNA (guanosine(2251)-2'-O)-methyltransferase RlmB [Firmicutes bacterium HGW-Firmicutes-1]|jgi:23S rRNA (guanosine2251-2'-O)-methyltransferase|nr:MAG: 23S rRNA (guanosine(2251)-2'-O)-methyltransferase RlmB [Firmicutes bacterium HGW-Firmicutes-1]